MQQRVINYIFYGVNSSFQNLILPARSSSVAPVGNENPDIFLAALIRVDTTYSLNVAACSGLNTSFVKSKSTGCVDV